MQRTLRIPIAPHRLGLALRVKHPHVLQVVTEISPFVRSQNPQGKANDGPQVQGMVLAVVMLLEIMDL